STTRASCSLRCGFRSERRDPKRRHKKVTTSMKLLNHAFAIALLSSVALVARAAEADPIVQVTGGQIKGRLLPSGGAVFKGVPFAQPPVGDLRWRDPAPVKSWTGVRDALDFGPACTQQISRTNLKQTENSQEDCLSLNLWTAEWPSK